MRQVRELVAVVQGLVDWRKKSEEHIAALEVRIEKLEKAKSYLTNRPPFRIPRFPYVLVDLGLDPPEGLKVQRRPS